MSSSSNSVLSPNSSEVVVVLVATSISPPELLVLLVPALQSEVGEGILVIVPSGDGGLGRLVRLPLMTTSSSWTCIMLLFLCVKRSSGE